MNRFFRSAFFPLIVIVLLVWLASQTLIPKSHHTAEDDATRELQTLVQDDPRRFSDGRSFNPSKRAITATLDRTATTTVTVHYPSDQSQLQFQNLLDREEASSTTRRAPAASRGRR